MKRMHCVMLSVILACFLSDSVYAHTHAGHFGCEGEERRGCITLHHAWSGTENRQGWKEAYIDYINVNGKLCDPLCGNYMEIYKLVDINGDEVPELYINFGSTAGGDVICSYYDGAVIEQTMWNYGFSYLEGQNLFRDAGGHMDVYYDRIYSIEDGEFVMLYSGEYGAADNSELQFDADGNPIYHYFWNGTQVSSEADYRKQLNDVYDTLQALNPFDGAEYDSETWRYVGNGLCDYEEIMRAINEYPGSIF